MYTRTERDRGRGRHRTHWNIYIYIQVAVNIHTCISYRFVTLVLINVLLIREQRKTNATLFHTATYCGRNCKCLCRLKADSLLVNIHTSIRTICFSSSSRTTFSEFLFDTSVSVFSRWLKTRIIDWNACCLAELFNYILH